LEGISDKNESCLFTYRQEREDDEVILEVNGVEIKDVLQLTAYNPGIQDSWLHCWMALEIPKTDEEVEALKEDVLRLQSEFGVYYSFVSCAQIPQFIEVIKTLTNYRVLSGKVSYSDKSTDWSATCKNASYSYQREYRFLVGECGSNHLEPLNLKYEEGFGKYIQKNPEIIMKMEGQYDPFFKLSFND